MNTQHHGTAAESAHRQRIVDLGRPGALAVLQDATALKTLEAQLTSSEAIASFGHFKIDSEDRFLLSRSAQALLGVAAPAAHLDQALLGASSADSDRIGFLQAAQGQQRGQLRRGRCRRRGPPASSRS